jgi:hypothetical protein
MEHCTHGPDFRSVVWHGKPYYFTPLQAAVVALLWNARGEVGGSYLLENAGSRCRSLSELFNGNPAFGEMIVVGHTQGSYRLASGSATGVEPEGPLLAWKTLRG